VAEVRLITVIEGVRQGWSVRATASAEGKASAGGKDRHARAVSQDAKDDLDQPGGIRSISFSHEVEGEHVWDRKPWVPLVSETCPDDLQFGVNAFGGEERHVCSREVKVRGELRIGPAVNLHISSPCRPGRRAAPSGGASQPSCVGEEIRISLHLWKYGSSARSLAISSVSSTSGESA